MFSNQNCCAALILLAIYLFVAVLICAVIYISDKLLKKKKFNTYVKRQPYWLIKIFVFCAFYYPFVVEMLQKSENCNIKNTGELLFSYKDYFITAIGLCLAAAAFIREDRNRKANEKQNETKVNKADPLKKDAMPKNRRRNKRFRRKRY